jgi:hypothetical protein
MSRCTQFWSHRAWKRESHDHQLTIPRKENGFHESIAADTFNGTEVGSHMLPGLQQWVLLVSLSEPSLFVILAADTHDGAVPMMLTHSDLPQHEYFLCHYPIVDIKCLLHRGQ